MTPDDELLPQVYDELRRLAAAKMRNESDGHTLDATALVMRTRIPEALDSLISLYTATKKPFEAKKWRAERAKYPAELALMPKVVK